MSNAVDYMSAIQFEISALKNILTNVFGEGVLLQTFNIIKEGV